MVFFLELEHPARRARQKNNWYLPMPFVNYIPKALRDKTNFLFITWPSNGARCDFFTRKTVELLSIAITIFLQIALSFDFRVIIVPFQVLTVLEICRFRN